MHKSTKLLILITVTVIVIILARHFNFTFTGFVKDVAQDIGINI